MQHQQIPIMQPICPQCNQLINAYAFRRIPNSAGIVIYEGCSDCLETLIIAGRNVLSGVVPDLHADYYHTLLHMAYLALTTVMPLADREAIADELQKAMEA